VADYVGHVSRLARLRSAGPKAWVIILALLVASVALRLAFGRFLDTTPLAPFMPALPVAALICGWRKAIVLMALSLVASLGIAEYRTHVTPPAFSTETRFVVFLLLGGFLIALVEALAQALQRLEASAQLNADLFRELQHRVANNFQVVVATLQRTRRDIAEPAAASALDQAVARVATLGRLHRRLYDPKSYDAGLEPILREMLEEAFRGVAVDMRLHIKAERLTVGQMTTILLLVNEAAINAAKHAFAARREGLFVVSLDADGPRRLLSITDDGPGFAPQENDATPRFGMTVMRGLAAQLGGPLEICSCQGATIRVAFTA
jgi:hypothetical protein